MVKIQSQSALLKVGPCVAAGSDLIQNLQDVRQTPQYACFMEKIGWKVESIRGKDTSEVAGTDSSEVEKFNQTFIYIKKLPLLPFSILKILHYRPPLPETELLKLIKKHHVFLIKLQTFLLENSKLPITNYQLHPDRSPLIPTKTIWFDLTQSEEQLLKQMKPKTRYNLRLAIKNFLETPPRWPNGLLGGGRIKIISGDKITKAQLTEFYRLWSKNKPFNWLFKPSFHELKSLVESLGKKCFFILVHKGQPLFEQGLPFLAGCLILTSRNMASYWHNFSTSEGKKLFAPTLYVWEAIKEAKKRKLKVFDLEGVWDERMPKLNCGWKGFSHFKLSFGGEVVNFVWPKQTFRIF